MLFVYDKNNGVLEYLLSTGLDQLDIFKGYVKASLALATYLLVFAIILNTVVGGLAGNQFEPVGKHGCSYVCNWHFRGVSC